MQTKQYFLAQIKLIHRVLILKLEITIILYTTVSKKRKVTFGFKLCALKYLNKCFF